MADEREHLGSAVVLAALLGGALASCGKATPVVGSKNFTEQVILGELLAQQLHARLEQPVSRKLNLGGTLVCHGALLNAEIHAYVEYTGTALTTILRAPSPTDGKSALSAVQRAYRERFNLEWLPPLGFNNSFAILVRGEDSRNRGLRTISDLARQSRQLRAGFGYEFLERSDGLPGLTKAYGLRFAAAPRVMDLALTYQALVEKKVDVIAGDTTNGLISSLQLTMLTDDKRFFPRYDAAPVISRRTAERVPGFREALAALAGRVSEEDMRRLNYEVDGRRRDPAAVVKEFRASSRL